MTGEPPLFNPWFQVRPIYVAKVIEGTFAKSVGESGIVNMTAPFPEVDGIELPIILIAVILA